MSKFTKLERQYIKGIVHNYALQQWTDQDIVDYLHNEKKIDIDRTTITKIRNQVEQQAEEWYLELKQSRYLYLAHFKERIDTLYSVEKSLWEIANDKNNQVVDRRGALAEIHHTEKTLSALYDISRYLTASQLTGVKTEDGKQSCYGNGCTCSRTSMDSRTHSECRYCLTRWCHSTYKQDWCPNVECSHGLKGHHFAPYDEHNVWVECSGCKLWFKKQEILDIHYQQCNHIIHVDNVNALPTTITDNSINEYEVKPKPEIKQEALSQSTAKWYSQEQEQQDTKEEESEAERYWRTHPNPSTKHRSNDNKTTYHST